MSWIPSILELDREEHEDRGERYPLDVYGDDFYGGGNGNDNQWPKGWCGWIAFIVLFLGIVALTLWIGGII